SAADRRERVSHARQISHVRSDAFGERRSRGERITFRRAHVQFELRLVVDRQEVLTDKHEERHDAYDNEHTSQHDYPAMGHGPRQQLRVSAIDWSIKTRLFRAVI